MAAGIGKGFGKAIRKLTKPPKVTKSKKKKASPKRQRNIDTEEQLTERNVRAPARREENLEAGGVRRDLQRSKDAMVGGNKRKSQELAPKATSEEKGASAKRVGSDFTAQEQKRMQSSYDGKKAEIEWYKKNDPQASRRKDLEKELKELEERAFIKKDNKVKPRRPDGADTPAQVSAAQIKSIRRELLEVTQQLNLVGNQKAVANMKKLGKKVPRLTTDQVAKLKAKKTVLQKRLDAAIKSSKGTQKKARGGVVKRTPMMRGGMANGKKHNYFAGGSVTDNLTPAQKNMVKKMAAANKK